MSCSEGCTGGCGSLECGEGAAGLDGLNAFTVTTANFNQPTLINTPVTVSVSALGQSTGIWAKVGQAIFIEGGGYYEVTAATATTITVEIPDADTLTYNHLIVGGGSPVAFPAGVSPAGIRGPQGATGNSGSSGTNGSLILFKRLSGTPQISTSYVNLLAGTNGVTANRWNAVGDTVRISLLAMGVTGTTSTNPPIGNPSGGNRMEYDIRITVGGVTCASILGGSMINPLSSVVGSNGLDAVIDLIAINMSPFTLAVHFNKVSVGPGISSGTGYLVGSIVGYPLTGNFQSGDPAATVVSIDPTILNLVTIEGRHNIIGTGGGSSGQLVVPYAMAELYKI